MALDFESIQTVDYSSNNRTSRFRYDETAYSSTDRNHYGRKIDPHRSRGFCLNHMCKTSPYTFIVDRSLVKNIFTTSNRDTLCCRLCRHALYWTKVWKEL